MEKWILIVGRDNKYYKRIKEECINYSVSVHIAVELGDALLEITNRNHFLLVVLFPGHFDTLNAIKLMRSLTRAPILALSNLYKGKEKIAFLEAGADEYIQWPDTLEEGIASARALIRRYTDLNQKSRITAHAISRYGLFISLEYRKVFINTQEIRLPRKEFDLFYLLASNPERVFTHEQLYREVWGDDIYSSRHGLNSCLRRIRKKLNEVPNAPRIENEWGVGYCLKQ